MVFKKLRAKAFNVAMYGALAGLALGRLFPDPYIDWTGSWGNYVLLVMGIILIALGVSGFPRTAVKANDN